MRRIKLHPSNQILREIQKTTSAMDYQSKAKFLTDLAFEIRNVAERMADK